jgi:hypothetical protein
MSKLWMPPSPRGAIRTEVLIGTTDPAMGHGREKVSDADDR